MIRLLKLAALAFVLPVLALVVLVTSEPQPEPFAEMYDDDEPDEIVTGKAQAFALALDSGYRSTSAWKLMTRDPLCASCLSRHPYREHTAPNGMWWCGTFFPEPIVFGPPSSIEDFAPESKPIPERRWWRR